MRWLIFILALMFWAPTPLHADYPYPLQEFRNDDLVGVWCEIGGGFCEVFNADRTWALSDGEREIRGMWRPWCSESECGFVIDTRSGSEIYVLFVLDDERMVISSPDRHVYRYRRFHDDPPPRRAPRRSNTRRAM